MIHGGLLRALLLVAAVLAGQVAAATLTGRVLRVESAERIVLVDTSGVQHPVSLEGIEAPEPREPFGRAAAQRLAAWAAGRFAVVSWNGRPAGPVRRAVVRVGGRDLGLDLLRAGLARLDRGRLAWLPPRLRHRYEQAEGEARARRRGLWGRPQVPAARHPPERLRAPAPLHRPRR